MPTTQAEVNSDTVTFIPKTIKFPKVDINDFLRQAATDIITLLTNPPPPLILSLSAGDDTYNAILQLATILNRNEIPDKKLILLQNKHLLLQQLIFEIFQNLFHLRV